MKTSRGFVAVWILVLLASGCVSTLDRADRSFEKGRLGDAAAEYEAFLLKSEAGPRANHALFRLAMTHALPMSPVHDEAVALTLLADLISHGGNSPYAQQATLILGLENRARSAHEVAEDRRFELERATARLERDILDLEQCRRELANEALLKTSRATKHETLRREVERLTRENRYRRQIIDELRGELEELKRIDIETP